MLLQIFNVYYHPRCLVFIMGSNDIHPLAIREVKRIAARKGIENIQFLKSLLTKGEDGKVAQQSHAQPDSHSKQSPSG